MKKFMFTLLVLVAATASLTGCRVEGAVGDEASSTITSPR